MPFTIWKKAQQRLFLWLGKNFGEIIARENHIFIGQVFGQIKHYSICYFGMLLGARLVSIMVVCVGARHQDRDLVDQCQRQLWSTGTFFLLLFIPQRSFSFNRGSQNHDYDQCSIGCAALLCFRMKTNATAVLFWSNRSLVLNHYWAWGTVQIYQL